MQKAQGSLEYLLLIGGAVLVAVIVITLLLSITETAETQTQNAATSAFDRIREAGGGTGGGANLITDSSFEGSFTAGSPNDNLTNWDELGTNPISSLTIETSGCRSGSQCWKFDIGPGRSETYRGIRPSSANRISVTDGESYRLTFWARGENGNDDIYFKIRATGTNEIIERKGNWTAGDGGDGWTGNTLDLTDSVWRSYVEYNQPTYVRDFPTTWTQFTVNFVTDSTVNEIWPEISRGQADRTFYLDDVEIRKTSG